MMQCLQCGEPTLNPKFCSRTCAATFNNKEFPKRERKQFFCESCGNEAIYRRRFCTKCNPNSGVDWALRTLASLRSLADFHSRIRQLARKAYHDLGKPNRCVNCGYSKHLEICHLRPIQNFDGATPISEINSPNNLVALCPNCHWELDNGLLTLDES